MSTSNISHLPDSSQGPGTPLCHNKQVKPTRIVAALDFFNCPAPKRCRTCSRKYEIIQKQRREAAAPPEKTSETPW